MNKFGFLRVAAAIPATHVADCTFNTQEIRRLFNLAAESGAVIVCFPELSITSYTCADLFGQQYLIQAAEQSLQQLLEASLQTDTIAIVGMPVATPTLLLNTAVVVQKGRILGIVPKTYLPNYHEFYEQRWFASASDAVHTDRLTLCGQEVPLGANLLFCCQGYTFAVEICEDLWATIPPSSHHAIHGADLIFNLSATNDIIGKNQYLHNLIAQQSARTISAYVYASCGYGESTQDLVFGGNALICENGRFIAESQRFQINPQLIQADIDFDYLQTQRRTNTTFAASINQEAKDFFYQKITVQTHPLEVYAPLLRTVNPHPFVPQGKELDQRCQEIFSIQVMGLIKRIQHTHAQSLVIGISGGLDSTLALLVCVQAIDLLQRPRTDIVGITMPGFGTTDRTYNNALSLMRTLGITMREIPIREACLQHFSDIGHSTDLHNVTYENAQARERTQILMDVANQVNGFVVGTGDLSELALGWCTYNADHMSNYGVNCSIPKTLVRHLVAWVAAHPDNKIDATSRTTLLDIVDTPISPELLPADKDGNIQQKTEDLVGPYELHDFFLYNFMRNGFTPEKIQYLAEIAFQGVYDAATIHHWLSTFLRRFFSQQFKRSCLPDGPKVGSVSLSPRGDWRMPSDASPVSERLEVKG